MSQPKNQVTIVLMISSIVLLFVLQFFWLRGSYTDAAENFRKQTSLLFRNTIFTMHDSLIQRSIERVTGDSSAKPEKRKRFTFKKSFHSQNDSTSDSVINYINIKDKTARIEVFMTGRDDSDSIQNFLTPLISKMQMDKEGQRFIVRLGPDSLKVDSIEYYYSKALDNAGIHAGFKVLSLKKDKAMVVEKLSKKSDAQFTSEFVRLNPMNAYAVSFSGIEGLILKKITPQIFFSIFLSFLTIASFYVMYRNLRSQQRLMQIKNDFISNVTHELKTPIATVSVALEALKNFSALDNPARTAEYLEIAQNELDRLTLMTDKILKTAVFEDKGVALKLEKIDLDALLQQVIASMKLVFEKRKTQLTYQKEGTDFVLDGSLVHLTNVLYNLLDNALKYSREESIINITLKNNPERLVLSVKDSGIGIATEYQKKIFEKFFRVPSGDVHNTKGYGLGLSYVASVVKSHAGEITVESELGRGTCFIVTLPKQHEN
jgi:signal transduction histidine kinase